MFGLEWMYYRKFISDAEADEVEGVERSQIRLRTSKHVNLSVL